MRVCRAACRVPARVARTVGRAAAAALRSGAVQPRAEARRPRSCRSRSTCKPAQSAKSRRQRAIRQRRSECSKSRQSSAARTPSPIWRATRARASTSARPRIASCYEPRRLQTSKWAAASAEAIAPTAGVILTFDRQPAQTLFHADCGGYTSTSSSVWGGIDRPYLVARADDGAAQNAHAPWQFEVKLDTLAKALDADARTRVQPDLLRWRSRGHP